LLLCCTVLGLALGMVQPRLLLDGTPRPARPLGMRAAGAGAHRTSRWQGDTGGRDTRAGAAQRLTEQPATGGSGSDAAGPSHAAAASSHAARLARAPSVDSPTPVALARAPRTRPHAPTLGRAPPR